MHEVQLSNNARKDLDKLTGKIWDRVRAVLLNLQKDPRPYTSIKLRGSDNTYRVRISDYRIVYTIDNGKCLVLVLRVRHRREIHRDID